MPHFVSKINMKIITLAENVGVIFFESQVTGLFSLKKIDRMRFCETKL